MGPDFNYNGQSAIKLFTHSMNKYSGIEWNSDLNIWFTCLNACPLLCVKEPEKHDE